MAHVQLATSSSPPTLMAQDCKVLAYDRLAPVQQIRWIPAMTATSSSNVTATSTILANL
jgi:hypothetical protein